MILGNSWCAGEAFELFFREFIHLIFLFDFGLFALFELGGLVRYFLASFVKESGGLIDDGLIVPLVVDFLQ